MLLVLERSGSFRASSMLETVTKCGAMAMLQYQYKVNIEASASKLTPQGFLINNEDIQNFFENRFGESAKPWMAVSCELMAQVSCRGLAKLVHDAGVILKCIRVSLEGSNGAWLTAEWHRPVWMPLAFFPVAYYLQGRHLEQYFPLADIPAIGYPGTLEDGDGN